MGLYPSICDQCKNNFQWFSGSAQICEACRATPEAIYQRHMDYARTNLTVAELLHFYAEQKMKLEGK